VDYATFYKQFLLLIKIVTIQYKYSKLLQII